jgi:hypothetical protein
MNDNSLENITQISGFDKIYLWLTLDDWSFAYYFSQIAVALAIMAGLWATVVNLRLTRKNIDHLEKTNRENNRIQEGYVLQARLIELSHEWNSQDFVTARNWAALILEEFQGQKAEVQEILITRERVHEWIYISMIAHFFLRLSHIQKSGQIDFENAKLEFQEAISFWIEPLLYAYRASPTEERLRRGLIAIHDVYNPQALYKPDAANTEAEPETHRDEDEL